MRLRTALFGVLLFLQSALVLTGGAVRLTGSGLGCPTWPECTPGSYTPVPYQAEGQLHAWIEFGNRLLTFALLLSALVAVVYVLSSGRKDLRSLAAGQVLGIFGQGILGGITVLTDLHPLTVAGHLLLSMLLIAGATSLYSRRHEPHIKVSAPTKTVSLLSQTHIAISFIVLILGTIVTGSGPHAGDEKAERFGFDIRTVAILHADAVIFLMGLTIALLVAASVTQSTKKAIYIFFGISLAQGGVGYAQYLTGIPELLVAIHLAGATIFWIAAWRIRHSVVRTTTGKRSEMTTLTNWSPLDDRAIAYARALAMDAVQKVGNGHPGTAMALAPVAYTLFQRHLIHDPSDPQWVGRDRFILSCGHSSMTLYTQLFFSGYGLTMKDLQEFRTQGSLTPGHPEFGHTAGVEMTTGPLGAGVATAVGFAMAARYERGLLDPDAPAGQSVFDHSIWVICSDGDLQEGVSAEASSIAGTQELGNLNVIYDDNRISIEGDTHLSFTEDVSARYRAYGWEVLEVSTLEDGNIDLVALDAAMVAAKAQTAKPTLIRLKSVIAWPAPKLRNTAKSHGSALGDEEIAATKVELGLNPDEKFAMPDDVLAHIRLVKERGAVARNEWNQRFGTWKSSHSDKAALLERLVKRELPAGWNSVLPVFEAGKDVATRAASGKVINAIAGVLPEFWGGSADLAESNNTTIEGGQSFLPLSSGMKDANPYGRIIHFGIREHAMGSILNGITLHGLTRAFGGTFAVFSDYMRPSVRLAALMNIPTTFVWTHDSIGLGEDGPTHQPIEHLAALRAIPNFATIRPADANEVAQAWKSILLRQQPAGILLSRQNLPVFDRTICASADGVDKGAYILVAAPQKADVVLIATGSEVSLAVKSAEALNAQGISTQVVSAPCLEWFNQESASYRESVIPSSALRVSIEAGIAQGWREYVGDSGVIISLDHYGASASASQLFAEYGFTVDNVVSKVLAARK